MVRFFFCLLLTLTTLCSNGQVVINELCAANGDVIYDPDYFEFPGWIELHNYSDTSLDVSDYRLTNDPSQPDKWRIPEGTSIASRGHLLIWCDEMNEGLHTNFKIDADGEEVILSNGEGKVLDRIIFPEHPVNISYGRSVDRGPRWAFFSKPTPGKSNSTTPAYVRLNAPIFHLQPGRYTSPQVVVIEKPESSVQIRFTTDGSEPDETSPIYTSPFSIAATTVIKAKAFAKGLIPSETISATYFVNEHPSSLPVISISTKPEYLEDNQIGIYVDGENGIAGNCTDVPVNWNREWNRHAVIEYFEKDGSRKLEQHVDIRIGGACSRNNPQKSLVLKARDKYGSKTIDYKFFSTKQISKFGGLTLRNSGNDFRYTMFRDALLQTIPVGKMDIDYQAYQPAAVYINGTYWGIMNIREKIDADYFESNFAISEDDLELYQANGHALIGSRHQHDSYLNGLYQIDLSTPEAFDYIDRHIDVQEYINYLTCEIYYGNIDWPGNNLKFWRQPSQDGKFRWLLWDIDHGFGLDRYLGPPTHPTLEYATDPNSSEWANPWWATRHLNLLLHNPKFRSMLAQTMMTSLSTTFKPERVEALINQFEERIKSEVPYHLERWGLSYDQWQAEVNRLKEFAWERNAFMREHIGSFFQLENQIQLSVEKIPSTGGDVILNGVKDEGNADVLCPKDSGFKLEAENSPGYKFSHYKVIQQDGEVIDFIERKSEWRYFDQGTEPAPEWREKGYNDSEWSQGSGEFGYGDGDEDTVVNEGSEDNRYITTYFRHAFHVEDTVGFGRLVGSVLFDDGVIIYLNGEEVFRSNMPAGQITNETLASLERPNERSYLNFIIAKGKVLPGLNVIAVEIHQFSQTSTDMSFDLDLKTHRLGEETERVSTSPLLEGIAFGDVRVEVHFVPVSPPSGIVINEIASQNKTYRDEFGDKDDWIEIYNNGTDTVDLADFFVSDKLNNKTKHRIAKSRNGETLIEPGAYKLLWADGDVNQGPLHLSFKLSADGEAFGIYRMIGDDIIKIDEVRFPKQPEGSSLSRIPDVTGDFVTTGHPTPMEANVHRVFDASDVDPVVASKSLRPFPNPFRDVFKINTDRADVTYSIMDSRGRTIINHEHYIPGSHILLKDYSPGLYLLRVNSGRISILHRIIKIE